jgi:hypothetical protein
MIKPREQKARRVDTIITSLGHNTRPFSKLNLQNRPELRVEENAGQAKAFRKLSK